MDFNFFTCVARGECRARLKGSGTGNSLLVIVIIFIIVVKVSVKVGVLIVKTAFCHFIRIRNMYNGRRGCDKKNSSTNAQRKTLGAMKAERTYDHIMRDEVKTFAKNAESRLKIKVNPQRKSLMGILLLFIELYAAGARDSKKTLTPISPK